jgi:hypothetical protein
MNTFFSVLVLLSFMALFAYLMYKIVHNTTSSKDAASLPPYEDTPSIAQTAELRAIRSSVGTGITSNTAVKSMPLRDLVIKASFNSAFTGHYVNLDMIKQVLSRGVRFLDFQVFVKNGFVVVGYSNATFDPSFTSMTSQNCVSLAGVCSTIMTNAFSDTSPNKNDPLLVQFHLKTTLAHDTIANILYSTMSEKLFWNKSSNKAQRVTPDTLLGDLMGKVVVFVDTPHLPPSSSCDGSTCYSLPDVVNMMTGTASVPIYTEQELQSQMYAPMTAAPYLFRVVLPGVGFYGGAQNPDAYFLINHYAAQVVCEAFYVLDNRLKNYEALFEHRKSAFLSLSDTVGYMKQTTAV